MFKMTRFKPLVLGALIAVGFVAHATQSQAATITVAGGCFWCVEADFEKVRGVKSVVSGYTGGSVKNPTYKQVTKGGTGHYEAVQIHYNANQISAEKLYSMFFRSIDPTDPGGQFCDRGKSYRSAIFVSNAAQKAAAEKAKAGAAAKLGRKIVTPILSAKTFYKAEAYHQDYYKSSKIVVTRAGPKKKSAAYKFYRNACKRDARVKQLWGTAFQSK